MKKSLTRALVAVVMGCAAVMGGTSVAGAAPGNTVLLGDSYFANTSFPQLIDARLNNGPRCIKGDFRVATELSRLTGARVADYSCNGTQLYVPGFQLENLVDQAIAEGALNRDTRNVPIMIGANDTYRNGLAPIDNGAAAAAYDRVVAKIRAAAPNARLQFTSYPSLTNERGGLCAIRINGLPPTEMPFGVVRDIEGQLWEQSRSAAARHGGTFIDLRNQTAAHNTCAPGAEAWVAGLIDNSTPQYNLTFHMAHPGVTNAAEQIARTLA